MSSSVPTVNVTLWNDLQCPAGYICDPDHGLKASCADIQQKYIDFGFGNVLAGSYCPGGNIADININKLQTCPVGYYCPSPDEILICPKGKYCPHKSAAATIPCNACKVGSTVFRRDKLGTALFFTAIAIGALYLLYVFFTNCTSRGKKIRQSLENRRVDAAKRKKLMDEEKARLQKVRPFLENISRNLDDTSNKDPVFKDGSSGITFDVAKLFDLLDANGDKVLSFEELNKVLKFKDVQLKQFIQRMNEMGEEDLQTPTVSRNTFVTHFLNATYHSVNFDPTPEEITSLYNLIKNQQHDSSPHQPDYIYIDELYDSELSVFLSDSQIYSIIKYFKDKRRDVDDKSIDKGKSGGPKMKVIVNNQNAAMTSTMTPQDFIGEVGESDPERGVNVLRMDDSNSGSLRSNFLTPAISKSNRDVSHGNKNRSMFVSMNAVQKFNSRRKLAAKQHNTIVTKDEFIQLYPEALFYATRDQSSAAFDGIDVQFKDLSLCINADGKSVPVVDNVTGRIRKKTMTALMGGSGAGKTSLLNALCGRAYYGEASGSIKINGQDKSIKEISDSIGFVPQDDIVFAELTVKENLMFSGKFRLPLGTTQSEIEATANEALVNLGLVRVANSFVGDVARRGVSGGEKKRVNIGLELMAKPSILFLDEPTSGLDSSSAMLVMKALRTLVERQGMTVCSVIHQPRAFIFNLFDTVILLGVGGRMVYHGPTRESLTYFTNLGYSLPEGESLADWLIDISSGRLARNAKDDDDNQSIQASFSSHLALSPVKLQGDSAALARNFLYDQWSKYFKALTPEKRLYYEPPAPYDLPKMRRKAGFLTQLKYYLHRNFIVSKRNMAAKVIDSFIVIFGIIISSLLVGQLKFTSGAVPRIENEFRLLTNGDSKAYDQVLTAMFATVTTEFSPKTFATIVAALGSTLLALGSIKIMTEKRDEFFREAGSGYSVLSYFLAVNIYTSLEQGLQAICASLVALWLRNSLCKWWMFVINFCVLTWGAVSWALLFAIIVPPKNIVLMTSFFMVLSALMLSGALVGVMYKDIYKTGKEGMAFICGILSPTRFFVEMMVVSEYRALGPQYGFTVDKSIERSANWTRDDSMFNFYSLGINDFPRKWKSTLSELGSIPPIFRQSESGWYWGVPPSLLAGLAIRILACIAILTVNRAKQIKEPVIRWSLKSTSWIKIKMEVADKTTLLAVLGLSILFVIFLIFSGLLML